MTDMGLSPIVWEEVDPEGVDILAVRLVTCVWTHGPRLVKASCECVQTAVNALVGRGAPTCLAGGTSFS